MARAGASGIVGNKFQLNEVQGSAATMSR